MPTDIKTILKLKVPVIVQIGRRELSVEEVVSFCPGSIIELPKGADDPLDLLINNISVGDGTAVKVGENFGIKVKFVGSAEDRIKAMAGEEF